jgi:hypothetical protein
MIACSVMFSLQRDTSLNKFLENSWLRKLAFWGELWSQHNDMNTHNNWKSGYSDRRYIHFPYKKEITLKQEPRKIWICIYHFTTPAAPHPSDTQTNKPLPSLEFFAWSTGWNAIYVAFTAVCIKFTALCLCRLFNYAFSINPVDHRMAEWYTNDNQKRLGRKRPYCPTIGLTNSRCR